MNAYGVNFRADSPLARILENNAMDQRLTDREAYLLLLRELGVVPPTSPADDELLVSELYDLIEEQILGPLSYLMRHADSDGLSTSTDPR